MTILILCVVCLVVWSSDASYDPDFLYFGLERQSDRLNRVLICLNTDNQLTVLTKYPKNMDIHFKLIDGFPELNIEYHSVEECVFKIEEQEDIVAVIAPKPLPLSSEIPMYFFDSPYLGNEDKSEEIPKYFDDNRYLSKNSNEEADVDAFPNGLFPLRDHWQSLKYAFSHYLMTHGWKRIAVVSDDSYYSQAFEMKLVEHLKEKDFLYSVQRCVTTSSGCKFEKALGFLKNNNVFIIIANIQGQNAKNLVKAMQTFKMLSNRYLWLVRDWPFQDVYTGNLQQMVSLTLSPLATPDYKFEREGGPHLNSVYRGLTLLSVAIKSVNEKDKERIDYYYKSIYTIMNNTNKCDQATLFIRKFISGKLIDIQNAVIHNSGHVGPYTKDSILADHVSDLGESCLQRSGSFEDPCNDTWIVVICVVWLMFIIIMVSVVYFFKDIMSNFLVQSRT